MGRYRCRVALHHVVTRRSWNAVLVWAVVNHRCMSSEIVVRRRSCGSPLQRGRFPGIVTGLHTSEDAPEQVEEEDQLSGDGHNRCIRHKPVQRKQMMQISDLSQL